MHILQDYDLIEHVLQAFQDTYLNIDSCPTMSKKQAINLLPLGTEELLDAIYSLSPNQNSKLKQDLTEYSESYFVVPDKSLNSKRFVRVTYDIDVSFRSMMVQLKRDTGKSLKILSGYRSPAYQAILLLGGYYSYYYDIETTLKTYMPPGYSEHGDINKLAIDITTTDTLDHHFDKSECFRWLTANATNYGYFLSYPESQTEMSFEPWHWHYSDITSRTL